MTLEALSLSLLAYVIMASDQSRVCSSHSGGLSTVTHAFQLFYVCILGFFFFGCTVWLVGSYFSNQGLNLSPWLGKHRVLTTRSPGDSHISALDTTIEPLCAALPHPGLGSHPPLSLQSFLLFAPCTSFLILLKPLFFTFLM